MRTLFRSQMFLTFWLLLLGLTTTFSQPKLEPVPENIKVVEQPGSPVEVSIDGVYPISSYKHFAYTLRNVGTKEIRGIIMLNDWSSVMSPVYLGLTENPMHSSFGYESGFESGSKRTFAHPVISLDGKLSSTNLSVDWVLFNDGTTWGPDKQGRSEFVLGILDGQKRLLMDVKKLTADKNDVGLTTLLTKEPFLPEIFGIANKTMRHDAFGRGYGVALLRMRNDLLSRGDLSGISARIRDLERSLGLAPPANDKLKQITISYIPKEPIKVTGFSLAGNDHALDERFPASVDWLKGFRLKVKNTSGRTITNVIFTVVFPETNNVKFAKVWDLHYGRDERRTVPTGHEFEPSVASGEMFEIILDEKEFVSLKKYLDPPTGLDNISRVFLEISSIGFDDGLRWSGGQFLKQDPENPRRWIPIPNPSAEIKK